MHQFSELISLLAAGNEVPLLFSIHYAAPEVIEAMCSGAHTIIASGAVDVWVRFNLPCT
jgi:hypothetical protein